MTKSFLKKYLTNQEQHVIIEVALTKKQQNNNEKFLKKVVDKLSARCYNTIRKREGKPRQTGKGEKK